MKPSIAHKNSHNSSVKYAFPALALSVLALGVALFAVFGAGSKNIAYVRSPELITQYRGLIESQQRFERSDEARQANIATLEAELQSGIERYRSEYGTLSTPERHKREQQLEQRRIQFVKYTQESEQQAAEEEQTMLNGVFGQINDFVAEYGKSSDYDMIFGTTMDGAVLYGADAVDITDEVVRALNAHYSGRSGALAHE